LGWGAWEKRGVKKTRRKATTKFTFASTKKDEIWGKGKKDKMKIEGRNDPKSNEGGEKNFPFQD